MLESLISIRLPFSLSFSSGLKSFSPSQAHFSEPAGRGTAVFRQAQLRALSEDAFPGLQPLAALHCLAAERRRVQRPLLGAGSRSRIG